jgi:CheY-like chemotaxis protein
VRTVLIVEDDDGVRSCISENLRLAGDEVVAVSTTTEALAELDAGTRLDIAVIDVKMPPGHPHGFAFGRMARLQRRPNLPLVFMSGDAGIADADSGAPLGPTLQKPVRIDELIRVLDAELLGASP